MGKKKNPISTSELRPARARRRASGTSRAVRVPGRAPAFPAMLAGDVLVQVGAPARTPGDDDLAVLDRRRLIDQLVLPRDVVDVDLHDPDVRHARAEMGRVQRREVAVVVDRKSTRLNSSHSQISYAVFCLKKKKKKLQTRAACESDRTSERC